MNVLGACKDCPGKVLRCEEKSHYLLQQMTAETVHRAAAAHHAQQVMISSLMSENAAFKAALVPGHITIKYPNGNIYSGEVDASGAKHGRGTLEYAGSDHYYSGQWVQNMMEGVGTCKSAAKTSHGTWRDGKKHGLFHEVYSS
eukprot:gene41090-50852_t